LRGVNGEDFSATARLKVINIFINYPCC